MKLQEFANKYNHITGQYDGTLPSFKRGFCQLDRLLKEMNTFRPRDEGVCLLKLLLREDIEKEKDRIEKVIARFEAPQKGR